MRIILALLGALLWPLAASAQEVLPRPQAPFPGFQGRTVEESSPPQFVQGPKAPQGAPNVLLILTDDVGFSAGSTFGGPIPTLTQDELAREGLRYTVFHTTGVCSPTRAALMTGRNATRVGMGVVPEAAVGYDSIHGMIPRNAATVARVLQGNGYSTAAFGKWHLTPPWEASNVGPFDHWPTHMGFDYFYGMPSGATDHWAPQLLENTRAIDAPRVAGYHFDRDLADRAINWIEEHIAIAPEKPFFVYYATGAAHAPHQAPAEWIDRFKGKFDQGWDKVREETLARQKAAGIVPADTKLTPRPANIPAWDSLSADQKAVYARLMEVYAGFLAHSDFQMGRILETLRRTGQIDNTLVMYIQGDNGGSSLGGANGSLNDMALMNVAPEKFEDIKARIGDAGGPMARSEYPIGWGHALDSPFQWHKATASHFGGTRNGMTVTWPARIKDKGGIRTQFHHVIDVMPTILEAAGIPMPHSVDGAPQIALDGRSMGYSFANAKAPPVRNTQFFLIGNSAGIYHDGWVAATTPQQRGMLGAPGGDDLNERTWELYHVAKDFSQATNLAEQDPKKLRQLRDLFWIEAARNSALPIAGTNFLAVHQAYGMRREFSYRRGMTHIPPLAAPTFANRSFEILADIELPADQRGDGMLLTQGGRFGGLGLYMLKGQLVFHYNLYNTARYEVVSPAPVPAGKHTVGVRLTVEGQGLGKPAKAVLLIDGKSVAETRIERGMFGLVDNDWDLEIGEDHGTPVAETYQVPFRFNAALHEVRVRFP